MVVGGKECRRGGARHRCGVGGMGGAGRVGAEVLVGLDWGAQVWWQVGQGAGMAGAGACLPVSCGLRLPILAVRRRAPVEGAPQPAARTVPRAPCGSSWLETVPWMFSLGRLACAGLCYSTTVINCSYVQWGHFSKCLTAGMMLVAELR